MLENILSIYANFESSIRHKSGVLDKYINTRMDRFYEMHINEVTLHTVKTSYEFYEPF